MLPQEPGSALELPRSRRVDPLLPTHSVRVWLREATNARNADRVHSLLDTTTSNSSFRMANLSLVSGPDWINVSNPVAEKLAEFDRSIVGERGALLFVYAIGDGKAIIVVPVRHAEIVFFRWLPHRS